MGALTGQTMSGDSVNISTDCVGKRSQSLHVSLSPRLTMNYAAALGDANPCYFHDDRPEGIVAPPMLAVALTWPLSASFAAYWGEVGIPLEAQARQVHYNESIAWARPIRPDENLSIQGEIQALRPHPSGALIAIRYDAIDRQNQPVFTEYITGLLRGVRIEGDGLGMGDLPASGPGRNPEAGALWAETIQIDALAAHLYDGCTDIVFPIHTSRAFARQVGLPEPIYQGTAMLGLAVKEILNRDGGADPRKLLNVHAGFRGMVFPGAEVRLRVLQVLGDAGTKTVHFEVETPDGNLAIREGRLQLRY